MTVPIPNITDEENKAARIIELLSKAARASFGTDAPLSETSDALAECRALIDGDADIEWICTAIFQSACAQQLNLGDDARARRKDAEVYFLQRQDGLIKIGYSQDAKVRASQLHGPIGQRLRLLATMPGGCEKEAELHKRFARHRVRGEWFNPSPEITDFINSLPLQPSLLPN